MSRRGKKKWSDSIAHACTTVGSHLLNAIAHFPVHFLPIPVHIVKRESLVDKTTLCLHLCDQMPCEINSETKSVMLTPRPVFVTPAKITKHLKSIGIVSPSSVHRFLKKMNQKASELPPRIKRLPAQNHRYIRTKALIRKVARDAFVANPMYIGDVNAHRSAPKSSDRLQILQQTVAPPQQATWASWSVIYRSKLGLLCQLSRCRVELNHTCTTQGKER